jgi:hypothetical protein
MLDLGHITDLDVVLHVLDLVLVVLDAASDPISPQLDRDLRNLVREIHVYRIDDPTLLQLFLLYVLL